MKILKLLNNKSFSILCFFFIVFSQNLSAEEDPVDIWNLEEMPKKEILSNNDKIQEENINKSKIYEMIREGVETSDQSHLIQIGVKDNGEIGGNVRETLSYILFSPSPEKLLTSSEPDAFYLDPYKKFRDQMGLQELT